MPSLPSNLSALDLLPDELLLAIFNIVLHQTPFYFSEIFSLLRVSHRWHDLITCTPKFWASIYTGLPIEGIASCIKRSQSLPLSLFFSHQFALVPTDPDRHSDPLHLPFGEWDDAITAFTFEEFLLSLVGHVGLVQTLKLRLGDDPVNDSQWVLCRDRFPALRKLGVSTNPEPRSPENVWRVQPTLYKGVQTLQQLDSLVLCGVNISWPSLELPNLHVLHLRHIDQLSSHFFSSLRTCTRLEDLRLRDLGLRRSHGAGEERILEDKIILPLLKTLELLELDFDFYRPLTSSLDATSLEGATIDYIDIDIFRDRLHDFFKPVRRRVHQQRKVKLTVTDQGVCLGTDRVPQDDDDDDDDDEFNSWQGMSLDIRMSDNPTATRLSSLILEILEWLQPDEANAEIILDIAPPFNHWGGVLTAQLLDRPTLVSLKLAGDEDLSFLLKYLSPQFPDDGAEDVPLSCTGIRELDLRGASADRREFLDSLRSRWGTLLRGVLQADWRFPIAPMLDRLRLPATVNHLPKSLRHVALEIHSDRCCGDMEEDILLGPAFDYWWCDIPLYDNRHSVTYFTTPEYFQPFT